MISWRWSHRSRFRKPHKQRLILAHAERSALLPLNQRSLSSFLAVAIDRAPPLILRVQAVVEDIGFTPPISALASIQGFGDSITALNVLALDIPIVQSIDAKGLLSAPAAAPCLSSALCSRSPRKPSRSNSISGAESPPKSATSEMRFLRWGTPQNWAS